MCRRSYNLLWQAVQPEKFHPQVESCIAIYQVCKNFEEICHPQNIFPWNRSLEILSLQVIENLYKTDMIEIKNFKFCFDILNSENIKYTKERSSFIRNRIILRLMFQIVLLKIPVFNEMLFHRNVIDLLFFK